MSKYKQVSNARLPGESTEIHWERIALLRTQQVYNIWPKSPTQPFYDPTDFNEPLPVKKQRKSKKKRHRSRSLSQDSPFQIINEEKAEESEQEIGPEPAILANIDIDTRDYGAMLKGEGVAIAAFVQAGKRIPRRG